MESESEKAEENFDKTKVLKLALKSYDQRKYEEASYYFTELIEKCEQRDIEWFIKRCDCHQHLNMDIEAMIDANLVVKHQPGSYKGYSLLGTLHQIQGHYDEALFCYFDCLEILWLSGTNENLPHVAEKCLDDIMRSARPVAELPKNIRDQSILTQLYILGNSLRREVQHTLAIRSMEVALIVFEKLNMQMSAEDEKDSTDNESLRMKIHFVLAQSQQGIGKFEEAIENFKMSLSISLRIGDVSYETKTYMNLSTLCLDQDRYAEAASCYIRLIAVGRDVLSAVGDDEGKFREHWSMEMEASILLNLCIAFKSLRLYDEALEYARKYDKLIGLINSSPSPTPDVLQSELRLGEEFRPKSVPTLGFTDSFFTQRSVDLSGLLQSKFILGDLYELQGDLESATKNYSEWMNLSQSMASDLTGVENPYLLDTASAFSCQGSVLMKQRNYGGALDCFRQQSQIAKVTKIPQLIMESALSRGDALIALDRIEEARKVYTFAQKLSRSMDDLEPECMCMWKLASVFAAEHRYTHAAYYCEQAVALANKCGKRSVQMKLNFELALYYQHSNSMKELQKAATILYDMIKFQEEHIYSHRRNGGKYFHEEERMLGKCYIAIQVIFHKLDQPNLSVAFGEAWRCRTYLQHLEKAPQIPKLLTSAVTEKDPKEDSKEDGSSEEEETDLDLIGLLKFLPERLQNDALVIIYTLCSEGFLVQVIDPGIGVIKSYLSSKNDAKPYDTRPHIEKLVSKLGKLNAKDSKEAAHLCNIYNSEARCLPIRQRNPTVVLLNKSKKSAITAQCDPASGDSPSVQTKTMAETSGHGKGEASDVVKKQIPVLEELYEILIQPLDDVFMNFKQNQHIVFILDNALKKIPFDALTNPMTHRKLAERFGVTMAPCSHFLKHSTAPAANDKPPGDVSSKPKSSTQSHASPRPKSSRSSPRSSASPRPSTSRKSRLDEEIQDFRRKELMKSFGDEKAINSLDLSGFTSSISRLVTQTATGTNVLTSPRYIPPYKQATKKQKCAVVGSPALPKALNYQGQTWMPRSKLPGALKECKKVGEYFDVVPVVGNEATKANFLKELKTSSVLHVASYADPEKGFIALSPDQFPAHGTVVEEDCYLITPDDLKPLNLGNIQLLILTGGHGWPESPVNKDSKLDEDSKNMMHLPELFLASGVSAVVYQHWNVPDLVNELFLFHFYYSLQTGNFISEALRNAKDAIMKKYPDPAYWSGFVVLGSDEFVDLSSIRKSQLHASLDLAEAESLNLKPTVDEVIEPETAMEYLQRHFSHLAGNLALNPLKRDVTGALIELLEEAMDRLTADSNADRPVIILPDIISNTEGAVDLLCELGFDFQPADVPKPPLSTSEPSPFVPGQDVTAVVFPHWNKDGMLLPAHQALTGLQDICSSDPALQCLARILPLSQSLLCSVIDLLAVSRHTPEVQLRVYDIGVHPLWDNRYIRKYLLEIGFKQVHSLLVFFKTSRHRTLLIASLQVFASLCLHRDQSVLEQLNITTLGESPKPKTSPEKKTLKTVNPVMLPRREVILTSSWMQDQKPGKEEEKGIKILAQKLSAAKDDYRRSLEHAKWWHKNLLTPQAQIKLSEIGAEKPPPPLKRKVKPGSTPSFQRESITGTPDPHDREPFFRTFVETMKKRDYANYLAKKRCDELESRYKAKVHEIYREYSVNG